MALVGRPLSGLLDTLCCARSTTSPGVLFRFPEGMMGGELTERFRQQSERFGTKIFSETVTKVGRPSQHFASHDSPVTSRQGDQSAHFASLPC